MLKMEKGLPRLDLQLFADEEPGGDLASTPTDGPVDEGLEIPPETDETDIPEDNEGRKPEEGMEPTPTDEPQPDEEFIPKSQVSKIVSERVNKLNDKYKDFDRYKGTMDKLIAMSGLTEEQFFAQLEQMEIQEQAKQMGVTPEVAKQIKDSQKALEEAKRTTMDMKYQMEEQNLLTNPLYEGYNNVKDQVRKIAETTGMTLEQAYWATNGPALLEKQTKLAEQRVTHNIHHKQKRSSVETDGNSKTPNAPGASLDETQREMADMLGMSADEYALYSSEDLDYDRIVEMKKKK